MGRKGGTYGDFVRNSQVENSLEDVAIDGRIVLDLKGSTCRLGVSEAE
jgi:hypothetical protein